MKLKYLLQPLKIFPPPERSEIEITSIALDSRQVGPGALFVALRGLRVDGHQFISQALKQGAAAILCESSYRLEDAPLISVENSRKALAALSARFFGDPSLEIPVIGVTGTNGKTTITYLVEAIFKEAGFSPAVMGTINYRHQDRMYPASHTTPEAPLIQAFMREVLEGGARSIVMEVSSHALDLYRVDGIHFDVAVFTNLTPDHLDYHHTLENYFAAKRRLFEELLPRSQKQARIALLNLDDPYVELLAEQDLPGVQKLTYSLFQQKQASIFPYAFEMGLQGIKAKLQTPWGRISLESRLLGKFNLSNLLAAVGVGGALGIPLATVESAIQKFEKVPGRLERIENSRGVFAFVDYAHTPDALKNVIATLKKVVKSSSPDSRILVLFGCGGDRDRSKRPLMAREVALLADWAMVTSDNPRTEDPRKIIKEILPGFESEGWREKNQFEVEIDRERGIEKILKKARPNDVVLIAGKGHETYQILGDQKIYFDDREIVAKYLS